VNRSAETTAHNHSDRIARIAWFCAFVLPLALAALLLGVKSAPAASPAPEAAPLAFEDGFEAEAEGEEDEAQLEAELAREECEIAEEEATEGEIAVAEAKEICTEAAAATREAATGQGSNRADECPIHSASAHASTQNDKLKLTVGYTTTTAVTATIQLSGPVKASFKRHLGKSGVLRFTRPMPKKAHGSPVVHIELPAAERSSCPPRRLVLLAR
jgi:hypothetical protein